MSARWRQAVDASPLYRDVRGTDHGGSASDRSARQLWQWLAWKSEHRQHSGLVLGWTQQGLADDGVMSRATAQRALYRLQRDGMYVPLVRGSSCGAPGQRRRVILASGLLTPVPLIGENVGPLDYQDQRRVVGMLLFQMMTRKRRPIRAQSPFAVRLGAWLQGDQNASVETPERISRDTRTHHSDALLRRTTSTYQVQAPTSPPQPVPDTEQLPRDSDESLAIEPSADMRDARFMHKHEAADAFERWARANGLWEEASA